MCVSFLLLCKKKKKKNTVKIATYTATSHKISWRSTESSAQGLTKPPSWCHLELPFTSRAGTLLPAHWLLLEFISWGCGAEVLCFAGYWPGTSPSLLKSLSSTCFENVSIFKSQEWSRISIPPVKSLSFPKSPLLSVQVIRSDLADDLPIA